MDSDWSDEDDRVVREDSREVRNSKKARELAEMSDEQLDRYQYFISACGFPVATVKAMMQDHAPEGVSIQNPAAAAVANATKLFISEVVETARRLGKDGQPITPDLVYIAFDTLLQKGRVPGAGPK